jgi:hypothetical protein
MQEKRNKLRKDLAGKKEADLKIQEIFNLVIKQKIRKQNLVKITTTWHGWKERLGTGPIIDLFSHFRRNTACLD